MTPRHYPSPARPGRPDGMADAALVVLVIAVGFAGLLWVGAAAAALITGHGVPSGGLAAAVSALASPADPASAWPHPGSLPGPVPYWAATVVVLAATVAAGWLVRWLLPRGGGDHGRGGDVRRRTGLADPAEATANAGRRALLRRVDQVRPSLAGTRPSPDEVGYRLGHAHGRELWCAVEDSALLVGPPRMGKGLHVVIPWILDAPGAVVATSTRPDTLAVTYRARAAGGGPVAIFDPQRLAGLPGGLRWSPVRGCESPRVAMIRARGLAAGAGYGRNVSDGDFWAGQTETALRCLLHAAALDGRGAADLYRWSLDPAATTDALTVLRRSGAADGWAEALESAVRADPRTRDSVWMGVSQALAALADPDVLHALDPGPRDRFDPAAFLAESGTLYLLASAVTSGSCAPLVAAFVEDITETARTLAARSPAARLDPPLLLALDEIANLTPLPSLPSLMAEGGGSGITTLAVLQSLAQARHRWGEHAADAIWDAATVKLVLGGLGKARDLDDIARLLGEVDEAVPTFTRGYGGERSQSLNIRQIPVMPTSALRTLPFGTALLLLRHARPSVIDLKPWTTRPDADVLRAGKQAVEHAAATGTDLPRCQVAPGQVAS